MKLHEDEFQKIIINGYISVSYSKNGLLYSTTCKIIDKIYVPSILDTCTLDLPVYYIKDNIQITLFLTKTGLLRNTSTIVGCSQEATVFRADHKFIKVFNKTTKLNVIKINLLKLFDLEYVNIIIVSHNINESISFFDYYFQNCAKNKFFITIRDMIEYAFMAIVGFCFYK